MSKPIIYGSELSPAVRTVLLTAAAIDLDYEFKEVSVQAGDHKSEDFLKKNPQHTIPTLEDDGKILWDSHAIATYLVSKYAKDDSLYPKDLFTRAVVDQRLHFESSVLSIRIKAVSAALRSHDAQAFEKAKEALGEVLEFLEKFLEDNLYMVGNSLTVADFSIISSLSSVNVFVPVDGTKYARLVSWMQRMEVLPYYQKANSAGLKKVAEFVERLKAAVASKK